MHRENDSRTEPLFLPPIEAPAQSDVARSVHAYLDAHTNQMLALLEILVGHCDTVWPLGTLAEMPFEVDGNVVRGPGVFDMKGGLVQIMFVLAALRAACVEPMATPSVSMLRPSTGSGGLCRFEASRRCDISSLLSTPVLAGAEARGPPSSDPGPPRWGGGAQRPEV